MQKYVTDLKIRLILFQSTPVKRMKCQLYGIVKETKYLVYTPNQSTCIRVNIFISRVLHVRELLLPGHCLSRLLYIPTET